MSVDPSALSLRVSPELLRHEILGLDGAGDDRAVMVVADVFYRSHAVEHFESLPRRRESTIPRRGARSGRSLPPALAG